MRTIKFRAWDKENKRWYPQNACCFPIGELSSRAEEKGYIISQFTGLLDKNGKEIYEGDVVKVETKKESIICEVKDLLTMWKEYEDWMIEAPTDCLEVIGNIFSTPELLKKLNGQEN